MSRPVGLVSLVSQDLPVDGFCKYWVARPKFSVSITTRWSSRLGKQTLHVNSTKILQLNLILVENAKLLLDVVDLEFDF